MKAQPDCLNNGPYEASEGISPVMGNKTGGGQVWEKGLRSEGNVKDAPAYRQAPNRAGSGQAALRYFGVTLAVLNYITLTL